MSSESVPEATPKEKTVMTAWPSISAGPWGRWLGRLFDNRTGITISGVPITLGWILVLKTIPLTAFLYFNKIVPRIPADLFFGWQNPSCHRYRVTNQRVVIDYPFFGRDSREYRLRSIRKHRTRSFDLGTSGFARPILFFGEVPTEVFRLPGVPHAEAFRQTCMKTRRGRVSAEPPTQAAAV